MLTVKVHQVLFELLIHKGLAAVANVVPVVVDPDAGSWRNFVTCSRFRFGSFFLKGGATSFLHHEIKKSCSERIIFGLIKAPC